MVDFLPDKCACAAAAAASAGPLGSPRAWAVSPVPPLAPGSRQGPSPSCRPAAPAAPITAATPEPGALHTWSRCPGRYRHAVRWTLLLISEHVEPGAARRLHEARRVGSASPSSGRRLSRWSPQCLGQVLRAQGQGGTDTCRTGSVAPWLRGSGTGEPVTFQHLHCSMMFAGM